MSEHVRHVKAMHERDLLRLPHVHGVFTGEKITNGKPTGQTAIVVVVDHKQDMPPQATIPRDIDGVPTDVIEEPPAVAGSLPDNARYDPLLGGINVGECRDTGWIGTLGGVVRDLASGGAMALSNYHIFAVDASWTVGTGIVQPAVNSGGVCGPDTIGTLQRAVRDGTVDAAVATITDRAALPQIAEVGEVAGPGTPAVGMAVRKRGRTTGLTYGTIAATDYTGSVSYAADGVSVLFTNQLRIVPDTAKNATFFDHGDSGSLVLDDRNRVVGLAFALSGSAAIANPIAPVLSAMAVQIVGTEAAFVVGQSVIEGADVVGGQAAAMPEIPVATATPRSFVVIVG